MKTVIIVIQGYMNLYSKNIKHEDLYMLRQYYLHIKNREQVDYIVYKPQYSYEKSLDTDLNDYDEILIYNAPYNLFGGVMDSYSYIIFNKLLKCNLDHLEYVLVDPKLYYKDLGSYYKLRIHTKSFNIKGKLNYGPITDEQCDRFTVEQTPKIRYVFSGQDFLKFKEFIKDKHDYEYENIELNEFGAVNNTIIYPKASFNREYDITYYGNDRKTDRNKILDMYFKNEDKLKKYWIGYDPNYLNCTTLPYIHKNKLVNELIKSYATLVLGDKSHNKNIRTVRFFEALHSDLVAFFHKDYVDENMIHDKKIRDFCIISNIFELREKISIIKSDETLFNHYKELQLKEIDFYKHYKINSNLHLNPISKTIKLF
jgi:hypothetical protein